MNIDYKLQVMTVSVLSSLLTVAQNLYCHGTSENISDYEKDIDWQDSYARNLTKCTGFPERELVSLLSLAKTEHKKYEAMQKFDVYGDPDWATWYAEFMLPYLEAPHTAGDDSQFDGEIDTDI